MDISAITNLGTGGFAILVMWWMYQSSSKRIDDLNKEVRDKILDQLNKNTNAFEKVLAHFSRHSS